MRPQVSTDKVVDHVTRMAQDQELRDHARNALDSIMAVYAKVQEDGPRKAAADKRLTEELANAATELRETARRVSAPQPERDFGLIKLLLLAALVAAAALGIKRALSSDEDEFEYRP